MIVIQKKEMLMEIIHNIALDVSRHGVQAAIPITRGEVGVHRLVITLRNKGEPIKLTKDDTAVVYLDTDMFAPAIVYTEDGVYPNSIVYDVSARAASVTGARKVTVQLSRTANHMYFSADIIFKVCQNNTYGSAVLDSPPYAAVLKAQTQAESLCNLAEEKIESIEPRVDVLEEQANTLRETKLDKIEKKDNVTYAYAIQSGEQTVVKASAGADYGTFVFRSATDGRVDTVYPKTDNNIANMKYVKDVAKTKLDIQSPTEAGKKYAYIIDSDGNQTTGRVDSGLVPDTLVYRDSKSQFMVPYPTNMLHAVNKQYVDGGLSIISESLSIVEGIAKGANRAWACPNYAEVIPILETSSVEEVNLGQSIYINTLNVPDLWVCKKYTDYKGYIYTTDDAFVEDLMSNSEHTVQIGYFGVAPLETQKVDLTEYASKEYVKQYVNDEIFGGEW